MGVSPKRGPTAVCAPGVLACGGLGGQSAWASCARTVARTKWPRDQPWVFLGIFSTFGAGSALALLASSWLGWNRAAAVLGTLIANPLLNPLFLSLSVIAGNLVVPSEFRIVLETFRQGDWWPRLLNLLPTYFVGNLLVSTLFAVLAYAAGLFVVTKYRKRRARHSRQIGNCC